MWRRAALDVALTLLDRPSAVRHVSRATLPEGVTLLLQVAAREPDALSSAQALTGRSEAAVQDAAGFFIEQVLFHREADSYRMLGTGAGATRSELRQNMALLMRWLHPDGREQRATGSDLDRGIFIHRVTRAWEDLKTDERREAYDRTLREKQQREEASQVRARAAADASSPNLGPGPKRPRQPERTQRSSAGKPQRKRGGSRLVIHRFERDSLLGRLILYLQGRD